jgi:hypothetical protein
MKKALIALAFVATFAAGAIVGIVWYFGDLVASLPH